MKPVFFLYRCQASAVLFLLIAVSSAAPAEVVLNEVMYRPASESVLEEYIELFNASATNVSLGGWRLDKGVDFTFPASTVLAPGAYLVVAADTNTFKAKYPGVNNVIGNWLGQLSNPGETIRLVDAASNEVDRLTYSDSGDWGTRLRGLGEDRALDVRVTNTTVTVRCLGWWANGDQVVISGADRAEYNGTFTIATTGSPNLIGFTYSLPSAPSGPPTGVIVVRQINNYGHAGWSWSSRADGKGSSLEVVNPRLPNNTGQNWRSSVALNGTPGRVNSVFTADAAPLVLDVIHFPPVPTATDIVTVTARLVDETNANLQATLYWRAEAGSPPFNAAVLSDDGLHNDGAAGDGLFAAQIPAQPDRTVVEFYVEARDAQNNIRTWPAPALDNSGNSIQQANALYQVDATPAPGDQPQYRLVMRESERAELAAFPGVVNNCNATMNATFISVDGVSTEARYLAGTRNRGAGTRSANPPNYRVAFPGDTPFHGVESLNLNSQFTHAQVAGYALSSLAGLNTEAGRRVQLLVNSTNRASSGLRQFGSYIQLESSDKFYAETHFPNDPGGNLYRCQDGSHRVRLNYISTNYLDYANIGYLKQNNSGENDWSDLINLCAALNNTPDANYAAAVRQVVNVEEWMRYFAVFSLLLSRETSFATGQGDDYSMYRGGLDPRFQLLAHDWDTILNEGDTTGGFTDSLFRMCPSVNAGANTTVLNRFMLHPEFVPLYYAELKRLAETVFAPAQVGQTLDQVLGDWTAQANINNMKTFASNRVAWVLSQIPTNISASSALPVSNGYFSTTSPTVTLFGASDAIRTRAVLVGGSPASWLAWQARWTNTVNLNPGLNRILIQALNTNSVEFERSYVDVWYDDGSVQNLAGPISTDTTLTPAGGPYRIATSLTVNSPATLTIQPGTTVYFGAGASLTVASGARLLAEGTESARIRFTREPGTAGNWGNIVINGAVGSPETRIAYADFEFNANNTGTPCLQVGAGTVFFDHLTFANTAAPYIHVDGASFVIQDCVFPSATGLFEPVHGTGGIKSGGRGIFLRNFFGVANSVSGNYNDVVDFTGGNRNLGQPIVQFVNNVFVGSGDDLLDLDGTDAWIEGNIFLHAHKNGSPDSSSAISGGLTGSDRSEITIIGNLIYDCDQAVNAKEGNFYTLLNNTIVRTTSQGGTDTTSAVGLLADVNTAEGAGLYFEGNIISDAEQLIYGRTNSVVTFTNNIITLLQGAAWSGPGGGNSAANPLFNFVPSVAQTSNFTSWAQAQVMWDWFGLQAGSPAIGTGPGGLDKGGRIPRGAFIGGVPVGTNSLNSAVLTVGIDRTGNGIPAAGFPNGSGYTHYKWRLDGGAWSAETSIATPISLAGLANGPHYVEVSGKNDAGFYQDDPVYGVDAVVTRSATWYVNPAVEPPLTSPVRLNEVLASNQRAFTHEGTHPDVIELYNNTAVTADLSLMGLTDDAAQPYKFIFPIGTTVPAGSYLVLFANNPDGTSGLHLGFNLNKEGGSVLLFASPADNGVLLDAVTYGLQLSDLSIGRVAPDVWGLNQPTIGAANIAVATGNPRHLRINEWLAAGQSSFADDFIELFNPDSDPVDIGGLYLTDNPIGWPTRHAIAPLSFIPAIGFGVFLADGQLGASARHLSFRLDYDRGLIALFDRDLTLIDQIIYLPQTLGVSEGRVPNGGDIIRSFPSPTPGSGNPSPVGGCIVTTTTLPLLAYNSAWRYNQTNDLTSANFFAVGFNDSNWATGNGLLAFEVNTAITPLINTALADPQTAAPGLTVPRVYYFRTTVVITNDLTGFTVNVNARIDDGAIIYVNGVEVTRVRMNAGAVNYATLANSTPPGTGDATSDDSFTIPVNLLVTGSNVIAVELHQQAPTSSDCVWGMAMDAVRTITNCSSVPVVLNEILANSDNLTNADGTVSDWVELYNPSASPTDMSGMSLSDNAAEPRKWVFPAGISIAGGERLVVKLDGGSPPSSNNVAPLNAGFGLKANGDQLYLFDTSASLLDAAIFGLQAPDFSIGRIPDGATTWTLTIPSAGAENIGAGLGDSSLLKINEWMAVPASGDDWFEIFNPNSQPAAIGGLYLTDDLTAPNKHRIPPLSFIGSGGKGFAVFYCDNNPAAGADHTSFKLNNGGEQVGIFSAGFQLIDGITFGPQIQDVSEGRLPDGTTNIIAFARTASPGNANYLPLPGIVINEVLAHTDLPLEDAIELLNTADQAVDVSGWWLSDARDDLKRFRIPNGTVLPPGGFKVYYEYQLNPDFTGRPPYFSFNAVNGDEAYLSESDLSGNLTGYRATVKFGASENGVSFGRYETSVGAEFVSMSAMSFGTAITAADPTNQVSVFRTGLGATNPYPKVGPIVISEIMYHPPPIGTNDDTIDEYIELQNITASPTALYQSNSPASTWHLRDGVAFDFPTNVVLAAGARLLVVSFNPTNATQLAAFRARYGLGAGVPIYGPWSGKLDNGGEGLNLNKPDEPNLNGSVPYVLVERIRYSDGAPWASGPDGNTNFTTGLSLQRRLATAYGNEPTNWVAALPTPGAASGAAFVTVPTITLQPTNQVVLIGSTVTLVMAASGSPTLLYQWYFDGELIPGATNASLILNNIQSTDAGRYVAVVSNPGGAAASVAAKISIKSPPFIVGQPQNVVIAPGNTATFVVGAGGTAPLSYQWRKGISNLSGATNSVLVIPNVQAVDEAGYAVVITNAYGAITSQVATLILNAPPLVTNSPVSLTVNQGDAAAFSAGAAGSPPLSYQWWFNNGILPGQTNTTLTLANVQPVQAGNYFAVVTNTVGAATSAVAVLTVIPKPTVTVVATSPTAFETGPTAGAFTFTRSFATNTPLTVAFTLAGTAGNGTDYSALASPAIIPANQSSVVVNVLPVDDALLEFPETVVLTLSAGSGYFVGAASNATVTIADNDNLLPTVAITNPASGTLFVNTPTNVLINAVASDPDGAVTRVEFYWAGTNKLGETFAAPWTFTWNNAPAGSNALTAVATDTYGGVRTSAPVYLVLNARPTVAITSPANGAAFLPGSDITINASAGDADGTVTQVQLFAGGALLQTFTQSPYTYTWPGVTNGTYVLTARATDNRGAVQTSAVVSINVSSLVLMLTNNFANRVFATDVTNNVTGSNVGANKEPGEPNHAGRVGGQSVWIGWVAPASGTAVVDTMGSSFNTLLGIYTGTAVNALTTIASNDNADGSIQSRVTFNAVAGVAYNIAVDGRGTTPTGTIQLHFGLTAVNSPPVILAQPQSRSVSPGGTASFSVTAAGTAPLSYQWRFNGADLSGSTASNLVISGVSAIHEGGYSIVVSNPYGAVTSAVATLTVADGLVTSNAQQLVAIESVWRFNQSGTSLETAWRNPGYDDSTWPAGPGLLGSEDSVPYPYFAPITTPMVPPLQGGPITIYLRTHFQFTNAADAVSLTCSNWVDDGAVFYLNGTEVGRVRVSANPVLFDTLGDNLANEGAVNVLSFPSAALVAGDNVLAAEVHQSSTTSSDVVFGLSLNAGITYTNRPVLTASEELTDGRFLFVVSGVPGRIYAVQFSDNLSSWTDLLTITNVTGQATVIDNTAPTHNPRFYRSRLVK